MTRYVYEVAYVRIAMYTLPEIRWFAVFLVKQVS